MKMEFSNLDYADLVIFYAKRENFLQKKESMFKNIVYIVKICSKIFLLFA